MDDGMMSAVPVAHLEVRCGSTDAGRCDVVGTVCRRGCCCGRSDDDRRRGCTSVVCGSVCTRTMLVVVNLTFFVSNIKAVLLHGSLISMRLKLVPMTRAGQEAFAESCACFYVIYCYVIVTWFIVYCYVIVTWFIGVVARCKKTILPGS